MKFFRSVFSGYARMFSLLGKILFLLFFCSAFSFLVVFPLWKWAVVFPRSYTAAVLSFAGLFILFRIIRSVCMYVCNEQFSSAEKKNKIRNILRKLLQACIAAASAAVFAYCILHGQCVAAVFSLAIGIILYGLCAFGVKK
ncbi:MAG: hypothetical protein NC041_02135 [Bacteroides sp.]|nr:hypothetical protein [Prevotella sp.]MCM1407598.1 hypothetical protein [Treponema brennaborense]MCM1469252.1 hypothetical protein [Bacteroides sp.]